MNMCDRNAIAVRSLTRTKSLWCDDARRAVEVLTLSLKELFNGDALAARCVSLSQASAIGSIMEPPFSWRELVPPGKPITKE
jgi:hypothetical protein